jgi:predicted acylesterase/phospholipase RssA
MEFKDLEYISLEGGGGKGAVYLGGIKALETLFYQNWVSGKLLKVENGIPSLFSVSNMELQNNSLNPDPKNYSILDYYERDCSYCKLKGVSGASAGAITAVPIGLGLTSSDIKTILEGYEFEKEFMSSNIHEGKYRMVGMDSNGKAKILVAEDNWRKIGENKIKPFVFDFVEAELNGTIKKGVGNNVIKSIIRNQIVSFGVKILLTGILNIYEPIDTFFKKLKKQGKISSLMSGGEIEKIEDTIELGPLSVKFFKIWEMGFGFILSKFPSPVKLSNSSVNIVLNSFKLLLPKKLGGFIPRDNITGAISNLVWDRGIYAGFEVREFFFRILLLSLSKDTHFRRKLLVNQEMLNELKISKEELQNIEGCFNNFKLDCTHPNKKNIIKISETLAENLTFENFYKITGVNLSCCVSNATYGQPMYFSAYFTPNYPIIEAMGASMSFPLAFKPLYNESNVLINKNNFCTDLNIQGQTFVSSAKNKFSAEYYKESFSLIDFNKYQNVVLAYIKETCKLQFSLNSNLSFRSYLPYLRAIIFKSDFKNFKYENSNSKNSIEYVKDEIEELCYFFYNSAFKGLHVDGGATNNLPIAVHTYVTPKKDILDYSNLQVLDIKKKVFSLKLDNSFPQELIDEIERQLLPVTKQYNTTMNEIVNNYNEMEKDFFLNLSNPPIGKQMPNYKEFIPIKNILELRVKQIVKQKFKTDIEKPVLVKLITELKEKYKDSEKGFTPWNKQIIFLNSAMTPLQFGMDQGQIESIDDNENIVPLYCFGLSVFDFDLGSKKLKPLVEIANKNSEKAVLDYFE